MVSNKKIYNLSKKIRVNEGRVTDEELLLLQEYRTSFSYPLSATFHKVRSITDKVDKETIVAFRLKRIGTIINKLLRIPTTYVNTMGDVAGVRCIFKTLDDVYKALEIIKSKFDYDQNIRDYYVTQSKGLGYKGVHIYVKDARSGKKIEIQLRTIKDHNWATLVEITDILYKLRLKEIGYESDEEFAQFHALISSDKELTEVEANFIYEVLNKRDFISKLSSTFIKNHNEVKKRWAKQKKTHSFFLIEASRNEIPTLQSFSSFKKAEEEYFKRYKENDNAEIVLTSIRKPNFKQISIAYANYILSYHNFMQDIKPILKQMAREAIEDRDIIKFKKIFKTYEDLQVNMLIYTISDSSEILLYRTKNGALQLASLKKLSRRKEIQIANRLNKRLKETGVEHLEFIEELRGKIPKDYISKFRYDRFLNKHNKRLKKRLEQKDFEFEAIKK